MLGHSHEIIFQTVQDVIKRGLNFGSPIAEEAALAKLIKGRFPSMEQLRFCNSGTEANMLALSVSLQYNGREKVSGKRKHMVLIYFSLNVLTICRSWYSKMDITVD